MSHPRRHNSWTNIHIQTYQTNFSIHIIYSHIFNKWFEKGYDTTENTDSWKWKNLLILIQKITLKFLIHPLAVRTKLLTLKTYLEDCEECDGKCIEVGGWCFLLKIELTTKELHTKQGKDENKQEEQEQEGDDGTHWIQQRYHQIAEWCPVPENHFTYMPFIA